MFSFHLSSLSRLCSGVQITLCRLEKIRRHKIPLNVKNTTLIVTHLEVSIIIITNASSAHALSLSLPSALLLRRKHPYQCIHLAQNIQHQPRSQPHQRHISHHIYQSYKPKVNRLGFGQNISHRLIRKRIGVGRSTDYNSPAD